MLTESERSRRVISLLDVDRELREGLRADELAEARRRAVAAVIDLEPPHWDPQGISEKANRDWLGLYLVEGLMIRHVTVGKRPACELFGPGDLFRPWDSDGEYY